MKQTALRIAIADDHAMVRQAFADRINAEKSLQIVLEAGNGKALLRRLKTITVDLVLLDLRMPVMDGKETLEQIKKQYPQIKVVILSGINDSGFEHQYRQLGAAAFISKNRDIDDMISLIYLVAERQEEKSRNAVVFTKRELQVIDEVLLHRNSREIAASLSLSIRTVESHLYNIFQKTGTKNVLQLLNWLKGN